MDGTTVVGFEALAKSGIDDDLGNAVASDSDQSTWLTHVDIANNSGSAAQVGFGYLINTGDWKAGQWDDSETASYVDDTTDAQDAGTDDFDLTTTTNNDGFVVQSTRKFNLIGLTISTAEAGSPVYEYAYWNGSAWTTFTPITSGTYTSAADTHILFSKPRDWEALATGDVPVDTDGLDAGKYAIRLRATTAPSTAVIATIAWVVNLLDIIGSVATGNNGIKGEGRREKMGDMQIPPGHTFVPYINQSSNKNAVTVRYFKSP